MIVCKEFTETVDRMTETKIKGSTSGRYMQVILKGGIKLDLFMPVEEDYWRQFVIRTGSREFTHNIIAGGWSRLGWCGVKDIGLRRQSDCFETKGVDGKSVWKLVKPDGQRPPQWKSVREFFDWLRVVWVNPKNR